MMRLSQKNGQAKDEDDAKEAGETGKLGVLSPVADL